MLYLLFSAELSYSINQHTIYPHMDITTRPKRVTGPLCTAVRARLTGETPSYSSTSGSEHEAATCLSGLVQAFLETSNDESNDQDCIRDELDDGCESDICYTEAEIRELLDPGYQIDPFRIRLKSDVKNAIEAERVKLREKPSLLRRAVAGRLCKLGYDSGICKSSWQSGGGLTAGTYEYIDVVINKDRYIVDPEFASGMEVARATDEYEKLVAAIPNVVVARTEAIGQVIRIVAQAARRSLRKRGMHVPPWRKSRYMLAKWLGPYKRTTSSLMGGFGSTLEVMCRTADFSSVRGFQCVQAGRTR